MKLVTGDPELNFWDQNPELKVMFRTVYKEMSLSKEESSQLMWAVYLLEDPNSKFYQVPRDKRLEEIKERFFDIDEVKYKEVIDTYGRMCLSKEENMYKIHVDTMDRLTAYLKELEISDDKDFNKIVKIMEKIPKMWDGLDKVKTKMINVEQNTKLRGKGQQSAREKRSTKKGKETGPSKG